MALYILLFLYSWFQSSPSEATSFFERYNLLNVSDLNWRIIIISLLVYLISMLIQHLLNLNLKKKDIKYNRQMKITDICLAEEIELYKRIDQLRVFQKEDKHKMLDEIEVINNYLNTNRILIRKDIYKNAQELIDYFTKVCGDFSKRDIKLEAELLNKYKNSFYE